MKHWKLPTLVALIPSRARFAAALLLLAIPLVAGLIIPHTSAAQTQPDDANDRRALEAFYDATDGPNWADDANWLSTAPLAEWRGVSAEGGRVSYISLPNNGLSGQIPPELGNLSELGGLILSGNSLEGPLPHTLTRLQELFYLDFDDTSLCAPLDQAFQTWLEEVEERGLAIGESGSVRGPNCSPVAQPPGAPTGLNARVSDRVRITLSWTAPSDDGGATITGYRIEISTDGSSWSSLVGDTGSSQTGYSHLVSRGITVRYRVSAINSAGVGEPSNVDRATTPPLEKDRPALEALYNATGGSNWAANANWMSDAPLDQWYGVTTNERDRVTGISLVLNRLTGELPPELGSLSNLEWLVLDDNRLTGEIPSELGGLSDLQELSLSNNQLSGEIPPELGRLADLRLLWFSDNQLTGCIPEGLRGVQNNDFDSLGLIFCDEVVAPGAPTGLTANANGQNRIDLTWNAPSDDGGAAITGYRIEVSTDGSSWSDLVSDTASTATSYSHTGLDAGSVRRYRVSAINSAGAGAPAVPANATTDAPTPTPTATPSATATPTPTHTPDPTATAMPTHTPTATLTAAATPVSTVTPIPTATLTPTPTVTPAPTAMPTATATLTATPIPTATLTATATPTHTPEPTATAIPTHTPTPTATPSPTATPTPTSTAAAALASSNGNGAMPSRKTIQLINSPANAASVSWRASDSAGLVAISPGGGRLSSGESVVVDMNVSGQAADPDDSCCDVSLEIIVEAESWTAPEDAGEEYRPPDPVTESVINFLPGGTRQHAHDLSQSYSLLSVIGIALTLLGLAVQLIQER